MNELIEHNKSSSENKQNITIQQESLQDRLLENALASGASVEQIDKLLDLKIKYDNEQARKSFATDLAIFKINPPKIYKDLTNKQYNSSYSSISNTVNTVSNIMAQHGFVSRWQYKNLENGSLQVTCILTHNHGHSESVTAIGPPDDSGSKNTLQKGKSTRTYLKLETFEAVVGICSEFTSKNDDGNSACAQVEYLSDEESEIISSMITDNGLKLDLFKKWAKIENISEIKKDKFSQIIAKINQSIKINKKKSDDENS